MKVEFCQLFMKRHQCQDRVASCLIFRQALTRGAGRAMHLIDFSQNREFVGQCQTSRWKYLPEGKIVGK